MTNQQALNWATQKLLNKKISSAALDAQLLLAFATKQNRESLLAHPEKNITAAQLLSYKKLISNRRQFKPVAYLVNKKYFFDLPFYVDKRVLIPRPETEVLIEYLINYLKNKKASITVADIGTGSGCIAITLKRHLPKIKVIATDNSKAALAVAKKNAKNNKTKIYFFYGSLLKPIINKKIDVIVANLPYLPADELALKQAREIIHEPKQALIAADNGLGIIKKLLKQIGQQKNQPPLLVLEHHYNQSKKIINFAKRVLPEYRPTKLNDLAGIARFLIFQLDNLK